MKTAALTIALVLIGCAPSMTPEIKARLQDAANQPVTCEAGPECDRKWSRATQWVRQNSAYRFQIVNDSVIQTYGPTRNSPSPGFIITKVATGQNNYEIEFGGGCDNMFGCRPSMLEEKASFVGFVNMQPPYSF